MIYIRPATPGDADVVAELIYIADTGVNGVSGWDLMYRLPREQVIEKIKWYYLHGHRVWFHYSKFIVADLDGRVVGALAMFDKDDNRPVDWWRTFREEGNSIPRVLVMVWRLLPFMLVNPSVPKGTLAIESAAVLPEHRGHKFAMLGLERALERARREGHERLQAAVVIGNTAPQKVCERFGFKVKDEYRSRIFQKKFGAPGMRRLIYEIAQ